MKALILLMALSSGCIGKREARTALDIAELTCALAHAEMFDTRVVADACSVADDLIPVLDRLLDSRRRVAVMRARQLGACP